MESIAIEMDEQALLGLNPNADADFRQRALAYFEQLKISQDAWQVCAEALYTVMITSSSFAFKFWNIKLNSNTLSLLKSSSS